MKEPTLYNLTITTANTEYSQALPAGCNAMEVRLRDSTAFRVAWVTGKVATPTAPYLTIPAGHAYYVSNLDTRRAHTIYIAAPAGTKMAEVEVWLGG